MRLLILVAVAFGYAEAAPPAKPARLGPAQLYRAARAECGKPGARIAQFMRAYFEHWLEPMAFGARVMPEWSKLTDEQRAKFAVAADAKLLAPERARRIAALCDKRDEFRSVRESAAGSTRYEHVMVTHHVGDDSFQVGWVLVEHAGEWSLDRVEVPSVDYPGIDDDPIDKQVRAQLGDYASATSFLGN